MRIRNQTYANTPIGCRFGTFTPDAQGVLDVPDEVGALLRERAGFALDRAVPRVLTVPPTVLAEPSPRPQEAPGAPEVPAEVPAVLETPAPPQAAVESPAQPADGGKRPRGPKPKDR